MKSKKKIKEILSYLFLVLLALFSLYAMIFRKDYVILRTISSLILIGVGLRILYLEKQFK